jgi:hypothetical protein
LSVAAFSLICIECLYIASYQQMKLTNDYKYKRISSSD